MHPYAHLLLYSSNKASGDFSTLIKYLDGVSGHCFSLFSGTACLPPHFCKHIPFSLFLLWCHLACGLD